jgi:phosphatidylinositol alpha-mannosyltransferase
LKKSIDQAYSKTVLPYIFDMADLVTVPSPGYQNESPLLQKHAEKTTYIPNGISQREAIAYDEAEPAELGDDPVILFVGNVISKKGPRDLLDAHKRLSAKSTLVIAGGGPDVKELENAVGADVQVLGRVNEERKRRLFARADVYCLPSRVPTEVFPMTFLEAFASETALLTSDLETFKPFVAEADTGLMARRGDPSDLSQKLGRLIRDPQLRVRFANNAKGLLNQFVWPEIIDQYEEAINKVADLHEPPNAYSTSNSS